MRISRLNNYNSQSFKAKNERIRKADDIQRAARRSFPLISSTYIDQFYSVNKPKKVKEKHFFMKAISDSLYKKLIVMRDFAKFPDNYPIVVSDIEKNTPYALLLKSIELLKTGNCQECAITSLTALAANGYYDSIRVNLFLRTQYINKNTGKIEYENDDSLDHSFAVTSLGKNSENEKDLIVLDGWLGFTDSVSGAKARFKQIYDDEYMYMINRMNRSLFILYKDKQGEHINLDDYELRTNFIFKSADFYTKKQLKELGLYARICYPSLLLDNK